MLIVPELDLKIEGYKYIEKQDLLNLCYERERLVTYTMTYKYPRPQDFRPFQYDTYFLRLEYLRYTERKERCTILCNEVERNLNFIHDKKRLPFHVLIKILSFMYNISIGNISIAISIK